MSNITGENLDFDLLFANSVNREDISEDTYLKGWYSIVGGLNGIPTVRQFNALQHIGDLKDKYLYYNKLDKDGGNAKDLIVEFSRAQKRENIITGESLSTIMGKIEKQFFDLKEVAFSAKYSDLTGTPDSIKNPNKFSYKLNGSEKLFYDGAEEKSLNFKAGTNVSLTLDAEGNITISSDYTYSHPTTNGYKHIPAGGSNGQWLKWSANGTATWATLLANNLTQTAGGNYALDAYQGKVLKDLIDSLNANKAPLIHYHDDRYYTEGEVNNLLNQKSFTWHTHDSIGAGTDWVAAVERAFRPTIATGTGVLDLGTPDYKWRHAYFKGSVNSEQNCNISGRFISAGTYNNTTSGSSNLNIAANGYIARSSSSSKRYKKDIKDVRNEDINPLKLLDVPIRQFKYKEGYITNDPGNKTDYIGFIVEELEKYYPQAVEYQDGKPEMWNYKILIPAMLWLIQDLYKK